MERTIRLTSLIILGVMLLLTAWSVFASRPSNPPPTISPPTALPATTTVLSLDPFPTPPLPTLSPPEIVHPKLGRYVAAWMPTDWDTDNARASFEANLAYIDEISPVWYEMRTNGTLNVLGGARDSTLVDSAHAAGVLVLPSITNGFDPDRTGYVLRSLERRSKFVQRILDEVQQYNYDGVDIDFEAVPDSQRDDFTAFIRELAAGLHERGKILAVAVHARTGEHDGAAGSGAQDWPALGEAVDRFRIMTYDYHWSGGGPGPVAPIYWVQDVVEYAKSQVDPVKIEVGIPFYGYDWLRGQGHTVTWREIQALLDTYKPEVSLREWNEYGEVAESTFSYRTREGTHTVWYAGRRSLEAKLDLVVQHDLGGIAIWRLGGEDPAYWEAIREKLARDPYEVQRSVIKYLPNP